MLLQLATQLLDDYRTMSKTAADTLLTVTVTDPLISKITVSSCTGFHYSSSHLILIERFYILLYPISYRLSTDFDWLSTVFRIITQCGSDCHVKACWWTEGSQPGPRWRLKSTQHQIWQTELNHLTRPNYSISFYLLFIVMVKTAIFSLRNLPKCSALKLISTTISWDRSLTVTLIVMYS